MPAIQLHDYQEMAKQFLMSHPKAGLFLDVGFGKTLTTLAALMELGQHNMLSPYILVIAPKAIARSTWIDEMQKWGINACYESLIVNEKGKQLSKEKRYEKYEQILSHPPAIYFINRELIVDLIQWHIDNKKPWPFQTVIIDELQSFKSAKSQRFKYMKKISPYIHRFIGLTGTPQPNGIMDLWAEIYMMDNGARLGKTISEYQRNYFTPGLTVNNITVSWNPRPGAEQAIYSKIKDVVISVQNPNLKLPTVTYNDMYCYMDQKETDLYKEFIKEKIITIGDVDITAANAGVMQAKLSQIASGTLYTEPERTSSTCPPYERIHTKKLEHLEYIVNNTTSPVLVAYHFKSDLAEIMKYFSNDSSLPTPQKFDGSPEMIHKWNAGQIPLMLLQPASAGHGINIQDGGHTLVWYTLPWSLEEYIQTNGRLNRQGQKYPVVIHHLLTHGTIDRRILTALKNKDCNERALMDAVSMTLNDI